MDAPAIQDLGWGNGWEVGTCPPIVQQCAEARASGDVHDYSDSPGPWSCTHIVECRTCGYRYQYDSGD